MAEQKCYRCGSPFKLHKSKQVLICSECETDLALVAYGVIRD